MFNIFKNKPKRKVFCISIQRTGTTSVGQFFKSIGFKTAGWQQTKKNDWSKQYFDGNFEKIFSSSDFEAHEAFEDGPWGVKDFYKFLYHRFPESVFVLFTRDSDKWFNSMVNHSKGKTLGNTFRHCNIYQRENEYYDFVGDGHSYDQNIRDNLMTIGERQRTHYKNVYENRNRQAIDFFKSNDIRGTRFIHLELESKRKWIDLGLFFEVEMPDSIEIHLNKSEK